jgi:hypothetical protein
MKGDVPGMIEGRALVDVMLAIVHQCILRMKVDCS